MHIGFAALGILLSLAGLIAGLWTASLSRARAMVRRKREKFQQAKHDLEVLDHRYIALLEHRARRQELRRQEVWDCDEGFPPQRRGAP